MFTADLASWLETGDYGSGSYSAPGISWTDPAGVVHPLQVFYDGTPWVEVQQDCAAILSLAGGGPTLYERTFDTPTVQVQVRGPQNDPATAEALAYELDQALLTPAGVFDVGPTRVIASDRFGGPPRLLLRDAARRSIFVATYIFTTARTSF